MPVNWEPFRKMSEYAEWVWEFISIVCPGEKPVVCGSGIGGDMTLNIACNHPTDILAGMALKRLRILGQFPFCQVTTILIVSQGLLHWLTMLLRRLCIIPAMRR